MRCLSWERYYDRATMRKLEDMKKNIKSRKLKEIGKVMEAGPI